MKYQTRIPVRCGAPHGPNKRPHRQKVGEIRLGGGEIEIVMLRSVGIAGMAAFWRSERTQDGTFKVTPATSLEEANLHPKDLPKNVGMPIRVVERVIVDPTVWNGPDKDNLGPFVCPTHGLKSLALIEARRAVAASDSALAH